MRLSSMIRGPGIVAILTLSCACQSEVAALELLASYTTYNTAIALRDGAGVGGDPVSGRSGTNGFQDYFSSVTLAAGASDSLGPTFASLAPLTTDNPRFSGIPTALNGRPDTSGGNYISLLLTRNPTYQNVAITIGGIWLNPYITAGNAGAAIELHAYSNLSTTGTGAGTSSGTWTGTNTQMRAAASGYQTSSTTAAATAQFLSFDQSNVIPAGTSGNTFEIRIAVDRFNQNPTAFALAPFSNIWSGTAPNSGNSITLGASSIFALVTSTTIPVPEPSTYVLSALAVGAITIIAKRRKQATRRAETA
ncbi:PEP-CTERM sorting domain-containing protein [bacterium]|nr:PEP-CTERM sorting domain-containing protein [bacterium]